MKLTETFKKFAQAMVEANNSYRFEGVMGVPPPGAGMFPLQATREEKDTMRAAAALNNKR